MTISLTDPCRFAGRTDCLDRFTITEPDGCTDIFAEALNGR